MGIADLEAVFYNGNMRCDLICFRFDEDEVFLVWDEEKCGADKDEDGKYKKDFENSFIPQDNPPSDKK